MRCRRRFRCGMVARHRHRQQARRFFLIRRPSALFILPPNPDLCALTLPMPRDALICRRPRDARGAPMPFMSDARRCFFFFRADSEEGRGCHRGAIMMARKSAACLSARPAFSPAPTPLSSHPLIPKKRQPRSPPTAAPRRHTREHAASMSSVTIFPSVLRSHADAARFVACPQTLASSTLPRRLLPRAQTAARNTTGEDEARASTHRPPTSR